MKIKFLILYFFLLHCWEMNAQQFQATYGGSNDDAARDICLTDDGGYLMAGTTTSFGAGNKDVYLIKINSIGTILWSKTFGGANNDEGQSIVKTNDNGFLIGASSNSFGAGNYDFYIIKIDSTGGLEWSKTFGGAMDEKIETVTQTSDGGYAFYGTTSSFGLGDEDAYFLKTDSAGTLLFDFIYGASGQQDHGGYMSPTFDNGFILTGFSAFPGTTDMFLFKIDSVGTIEWYKTYGGTGPEFGDCVKQCLDGGYIITMQNVPGSSNQISKTTSSGNIEWSNAYSGIVLSSVKQTNDMGFIISGLVDNISATPNDLLLMKIDSSGLFLWSKRYGGVNNETGSGLVQTPENGFLISGGTSTFGPSEEIYLIKTDSIGNSGCNETSISAITYSGSAETTAPVLAALAITSLESSPLTVVDSGGVQNMLCYVGSNNNGFSEQRQINLLPNPTTGQFNFLNIDNNSTIRIYDCIGKLVLQTIIKDSEQTIDISNQEKGIYFYRIENQKSEFSSGKIILQ